jgi:sugar lactone lactonase YvrE
LAACFLLSFSASDLALAQNTVISLTSGTSWTVPSNWSSANNTVEVIGSGGAHKSSSATAGAGGGSYSKAVNLSLTPNSSVPYNIGISGDVSPGESTWFGSTSRSSALVAAQGGCSPTSSSDCTNSTSADIGSVIYTGGKGGNDGYLAGFAAGGGGAAGPHGGGVRGHDSGSSSGGAGGAGDNGYGGAGGPGSNGAASPGGAGAEYTATAGGIAGSGGGAGAGSNRNGAEGTGGAYGGGACGGNTSGTVAGGNGLIAITYTPNPATFVANTGYPGNGTPVSVYPFGSNGNVTPDSNGPSATGLSLPFGVALDSNLNIYVANNGANSVTEYAAGSSGNSAPIATIAGSNTGLINPSGVALDSSKNIYVANLGSLSGASDIVTIFAAGSNGNVSPTATITGPATGLNYPTAITLDSSGNIYVANAGTQNGGANTVTVYPAGSNGNVAPSATISGSNTGLLVPWGIALDSSKNIYVANDGSSVGQSDSVTVYPAGSNGNVTPSATISGTNTGLDSPGGIAVDSSGNIYVTNDGDLTSNPDNVTVFSPGSNGNVSPSYTLAGLGMGYPFGIAVDAHQNIYVANDNSNLESVDDITVYPPDNPIPSEIIGLNPALDAPAGITIGSSGNVYVTNQGSLSGSIDSVNVYAASSYGNLPPTTVIAGSNTGLAQPSAVVLNPSGNIYVANSSGGPDTLGSVTVYSAGASQNASPIATIAGTSTSDNTGFGTPNGIALDSAGNIYVANTFGGPDGVGSITIYPPGSNGNVTPLATISDNPNCAPCDNTTLSLPYGVAVDSAGNIYVANSQGGADGMGSVTIYPPLGTSTGTLNEAPNETIAGTSSSDVTGFSLPSGIALDLAGNIYVTNEGSMNGGSDSVTEYAAGSSGNVAPIATITGASAGLAVPQGIAIGSNGPSGGGGDTTHKKRRHRHHAA